MVLEILFFFVAVVVPAHAYLSKHIQTSYNMVEETATSIAFHAW
jgi:hypothetical protein